MRRLRALSLLTVVAGAASTGAQTVAPPEVVGRLVGPGASPAQPDLRLYGTDLGWTYVHRGQHVMLFGDTWPHERSVCEPEPRNDDTFATIPLAAPSGVPALVFPTQPGAPNDFGRLTVTRAGDDLSMGYGQVPIGGFSDGTDAYALLGRGEYVPCRRRRPGGAAFCTPREGLACSHDVGQCAPQLTSIPQLCDLGTGGGCTPNTTCQPTPNGLCVDPTSSQYDGTPAGMPQSAVHAQEIAVQDPAATTAYRSGIVWTTGKFVNTAVRTVRCFAGRRCGNDYTDGHGAVLFFGRPGFTAEGAREAHLYLMAHRLPMPRDARGRIRFRPRYFAGTHPVSGEPLWTRRETDAQPIALDGRPGGDPDEVLPLVLQMSVAWIGPPVSKWVMLYGGDLADYLLVDPARARPSPAGAVRIRFADHPWGPWSPPEAHLVPGSPSVVGDAYGPGGILFHSACVSQPGAPCAPSDPWRPVDFFLPGCPQVARAFDHGRLYGVNVVAAWTTPVGDDAVDLYWNVSTWNPYGVVLMRTRITAGAPAPTPTCGARTAPRTGLAGMPARFRWCE